MKFALVLIFAVVGIAATSGKGPSYTYDSASDSTSDLHANRMPIRFSVRIPLRHQSNPILEIVDELNFLGSVKLRETRYRPCNRETGRGSDAESDAKSCVRVEAQFSCRTENRISPSDLHEIGCGIGQRIGCENLRVDGP
jgi:hypothetical protein